MRAGARVARGAVGGRVCGAVWVQVVGGHTCRCMAVIFTCDSMTTSGIFRGLAHRLLQQKERLCASRQTALSGCGCLCSTCLCEVSSHAPRCVSLPDLSWGNVFACPCVFATTNVFARSCLLERLRAPMCLRSDACLRQTCLWEVFMRPLDDACLR